MSGILKIGFGVCQDIRNNDDDDNNDDLKYAMRWNCGCGIVKPPVSKGGFGVRDLRLFVKALFGKWLWRFYELEGQYWRRVVTIKYGEGGFKRSPVMPNYSYGHVLKVGSDSGKLI